jgi:site-specific DNA-methyltransferase (adenine-specific)
MFSFVEDTVLDPFCGTGTTLVASLKANRNSIGIEIDPEYCAMALERLRHEGASLFQSNDIQFISPYIESEKRAPTRSAVAEKTKIRTSKARSK